MRFAFLNDLSFAVGTLISTFIFANHATAQSDRAPIPDLTGTWGRNALFLEQPLSGSGPVTFRLRTPIGTMDFYKGYIGDYTNPILKPEAAAVIKKLGDVSLGGKPFPTPHDQCWPEPTPFVLGAQFGVQLLQAKDEVVLLYLSDHMVRHVRLNVPHAGHVIPTWQGDSVGHYEGDTLVIDTVGVKVGPLSLVDLYGTPHSSALHVVERYRLIDGVAARDAQRRHESNYLPPGVPNPVMNEYGRGSIDPDVQKKGLQAEVTVDDPGMFTTTWSGLVTYRHVVGDWPEAVCAENRREYYNNKNSEVPQADKPDF